MIFEFALTPGLLGITCWLIEGAQLQHLHPNHDSLTEGGLDHVNILSTAMPATLPS